MKTGKRIVLGLVALLVIAAVIYGFLPQPVPVQTAAVERGALQVIVEEEGETRLEDRFTVAAPAAAYLRRIALKVGDAVERGQPVAELEAPRSGTPDPRTRAQLEARAEAAQAALAQAEVAARLAAAGRGRIARLHEAEAVSEQALEQAQAAADQAAAARTAAAAELAAVRALLADEAEAAGETPVRHRVPAPVTGRVLAVHRPSEGPVAPGEPLLDLGDPARLLIAVDLRSQDAVRIRPGTRVLLEQWGRETVLEAEVTRIAPAGFTAVSALGVEERRVPVEARLTSPPETHEGLGAGYRVLARFVVWESDDVLQAPAAALFRTDDGWAAFVVREERAVQTPVEIGRQAGLRTQILDGLAEGDVVIVHPPNDVADGVRVAPRAN